MKQRLEILAPAADQAGLIAAVNGGADGVYFGLKQFNARQRAGNFELDDLGKIVDFCHAHELKAYVTLNILLKDTELQAALDMACACYGADCDGLIVQDPGLIRLLRNALPDLPLQTSTQCSVFGVEGVRFFENLGFSRVVLPREMGLEEVRSIKERTGVELKVFGHGALCYAYSGQCLFSSLIGGRSGNRGLCAQPCRKRYTLTNDQGVPIKSGYLMSMRDLNTRKGVQELMTAGIDALKIEGRMKGPAYIYATAKAYSQAAEGAMADISDDTLMQVFNRAFTAGWLFGDLERINALSGRNKGVLIGSVIGSNRNSVTVQLNGGIQLTRGDGLSFGEDAFWGFTAEKIKSEGSITTLFIPPHSLKKNPVPLTGGIKVYRTMNAELMSQLETKAAMPLAEVRQKIALSLVFRKEKPVMVKITGADFSENQRLSVIPEGAQSHPLTERLILEQLCKTGETPYDFSESVLDLEEGLFLSKSQLNTVRREIVSILRQREAMVKPPVPVIDLDKALPSVHHCPVEEPKIVLVLPEIFSNGISFEAMLTLEADEWVLPMDWNFNRLKKKLQQVHAAGKKVRVALPRVMTTAEDDRLSEHLDDFVRLPMDGCVVPHYEGLSLLNQSGLSLVADSGLHLFNRASAAALEAWGCVGGVLSPELTAVQVEGIASNTGLDCALTVYGRQEMMVSRNCLMNCVEKHCATCPDHGPYHLVDERKADFPVYRNPEGFTRIFNSAKLFIRNPWRCPHVAQWQIQVLDESLEELQAVIAYYRSRGETGVGFIQRLGINTTSGRFKREVL